MKISLCIFAYKRSAHLKRLFDSIASSDYTSFNYEAHIFYDGPKGDGDRQQIEDVRNIATPFECPKKYNSSLNRGLANSIRSGVNQVFDSGSDAVIVLEDDLVIGKDFFNLITKMLFIYKHNQQIGSVTGFSYNLPYEDAAYDCFFSKRFMSWGWATWSDRWREVSWCHKDTYKRLARCHIERSGGDDLVEMYGLQSLNRIDSWAILFAGYHLINNKFCVYPVKSRILNKGFDNEGTHCNTKSIGVVDHVSLHEGPNKEDDYKFPYQFDHKIWERQLSLYDNNTVSIFRRLIRWLLKKLVL